jgi:hypothetical protein
MFAPVFCIQLHSSFLTDVVVQLCTHSIMPFDVLFFYYCNLLLLLVVVVVVAAAVVVVSSTSITTSKIIRNYNTDMYKPD